MKTVKALGYLESELVNTILQDTNSIAPYAYDLFGPIICGYFQKKIQALLRGDWDQYRLLQAKNIRRKMKQHRRIVNLGKRTTPWRSPAVEAKISLKKRKRPAKRRGIG